MNNEYEENMDNSKIRNLKSKEELYSLFYEITSEIKGDKIEIEEEEFQDNIKSISMTQLIKYIHNSIHILLKKKMQDAKEKILLYKYFNFVAKIIYNKHKRNVH